MNPKFHSWLVAFGLLAWRTFLIILSLTWILLLTLWLRSHWTYDQISLTRHKAYHLTSTQGTLYFQHNTAFGYYGITQKTVTLPHQYSDQWRFQYTHGPAQSWPAPALYFLLAPNPYLGGKFTLAPHHQSGNTAHDRNGYAIPHFLLLLALSPFAFLAIRAISQIIHAFRSRKKNQRQLRGLCPSCGYNLSGSPSASACPECGYQLLPASFS